MRALVLALLWFVAVVPTLAAPPNYSHQLAVLIDPAKLATLGERGANTRIQKCVYWLAVARSNRADVATIVDAATKEAGYRNPLAATLTKEALLRNLTIAERLGCLDTDGLAEMRRGNSPTVRSGPYKGQELSVDHIIPRAVCPELDNVIANLELMPLLVNERKNAKVGDRQRDLASKLHKAGLLSSEGLRRVMEHR